MIQILKNFFLAICLMSFFSGIAIAEETPSLRKNMEISVNPLQLFIGSLPLTFRIALTNKMALGLHVNGRFLSFDKMSVHGAGGGVSAKFFLSGNAISDSWYVEPGLFASYTNYGGTGFWALNPSVIAGHTWVWASGFVINLGLGVSYGITFVDSGFWKDKKAFGVHGIMPTGEFSVGWAW